MTTGHWTVRVVVHKDEDNSRWQDFLAGFNRAAASSGAEVQAVVLPGSPVDVYQILPPTTADVAWAAACARDLEAMGVNAVPAPYWPILPPRAR